MTVIPNMPRWTCFIVLLFMINMACAQDHMPPLMPWAGKSESLIAKPGNPWITPTESMEFVSTPDYQETMNFLKKLCQASPMMEMVSIGQSLEGREIYMVIASKQKLKTATALKNSGLPSMLVEAGIHAGEIDGKDAGMMLLRDIAFGGKDQLLDKVNLLFVPILNTDGHERSSEFNRPNQRGPKNMGWRTTSRNLNINRDFAKLDTREARAVVQVMSEYDPLLFMDIHVTDGADYQYDITFGGYENTGYSPEVSRWLSRVYKPKADTDLRSSGHIPGQLMFAFNDRDFSEGNILSLSGARYSDSYGDLRHMASVLVENHSLKPFRQRVLGTYVLIESTMKILASEYNELQRLTQNDRTANAKEIPLKFEVPQLKSDSSFDADIEKEKSDKITTPPDSMILLGIQHEMKTSAITNRPYVAWTGKPYSQKVANYKATMGINKVSKPIGYIVPAAWSDVIDRLKWHGIKMEPIDSQKEWDVEMYRIASYKLQNESGQVRSFEGRMQLNAECVAEKGKRKFPQNSVFVPTNQALGDLAVVLLEPKSRDSFFAWGFFNEILQRTEYMESYIMEPMAAQMLEKDPKLREEFEQKKAEDPAFAKSPGAILSWFYSKSPYFDDRYLVYPVARLVNSN